MSFFGLPRGRRKASPTIRITIDNASPTNNATLYSDSGVGTTITYGTAAWVQLIASTAQIINNIEIFDSTGFAARVGTGAVSSEVDLLLDTLGGNGFIPVRVDAGTRIAIRPLVTPPINTEIMINFYD